ncbi:MAG: hypothetical protein LUE27_09215, partial [Clostridia bacterium]|nr:hypothetical protein [Clostridia bacterium]
VYPFFCAFLKKRRGHIYEELHAGRASTAKPAHRIMHMEQRSLRMSSSGKQIHALHDYIIAGGLRQAPAVCSILRKIRIYGANFAPQGGSFVLQL